MVTEAGKAVCCFSFLLTSNFLALQTKHFFASNMKHAGWRRRSSREKKKEGEISNKYAYKPYNVIYSKWPFVWKMFKLFH